MTHRNRMVALAMLAGLASVAGPVYGDPDIRVERLHEPYSPPESRYDDHTAKHAPSFKRRGKERKKAQWKKR